MKILQRIYQVSQWDVYHVSFGVLLYCKISHIPALNLAATGVGGSSYRDIGTKLAPSHSKRVLLLQEWSVPPESKRDHLKLVENTAHKRHALGANGAFGKD